MNSHPSIRFERIPVVEGALSHLQSYRQKLLSDVVDRTANEILRDGQDAKDSLDMLLGQALYSERVRMKREKYNVFTRGRLKHDRAVWNNIHAGLVKPAGAVDRKLLLNSVLWHYAEEIGGNFDPRVYWLATRMVPWGFSWLLNAASVQRFLPWAMPASLESRLRLVGEIPSLQKLAQKGTILMVPTHQSNIDSVLIGYMIYLMSLPPFAYGAGLNLFSNPALSFFMNRLGAYTVDRQKTNVIYKQALKNYSTAILKRGVHSIFFPGGGRSSSGAIESKLKLGLMGTALEAQIENLRTNASKPNVYVVPMVMSYHFVLEASSLIERHLEDLGKHRYMLAQTDESWQPVKILNFFWKLFSSQTEITVRIGRPLDVFGNLVDDEGQSIGPNGTVIDPLRWLSSRGEVCAEKQRDAEYTRALGVRLAERYHKDNTVLTSHVVAFAFFEALRRQYPELDLFRFLRLSVAQRSLPMDTFMSRAAELHGRLRKMADRGDVFLSPELQTSDTEQWVQNGVKQLGLLHEAAVVRVEDGVISTEDMNLLYYYRNRLAGYELSLLADSEERREYDKKGFLA